MERLVHVERRAGDDGTDDCEDTVVSALRSESSDPALMPSDVFEEDTVIRDRRPQHAAVAAATPVRVPVPVPVVPVPARSVPADSGPSPYRIRVGAEEPIPLDIPAYIGRHPREPRIRTGVMPRLVTVPSPLREVSSTHVEVHQSGSSVIVTDARSTNGTLVLVPGATPLKLRQGESVVVIPGTVVDIGDGNRIEILPTQRLT